MRCNMLLGKLVALLEARFDMSQFFGLGMKAPKKVNDALDGIELIFGSDTSACVLSEQDINHDR